MTPRENLTAEQRWAHAVLDDVRDGYANSHQDVRAALHLGGAVMHVHLLQQPQPRSSQLPFLPRDVCTAARRIQYIQRRLPCHRTTSATAAARRKQAMEMNFSEPEIRRMAKLDAWQVAQEASAAASSNAAKAWEVK